MRSWIAMCEAFHLTVAGLWLGTIVMTGVIAAVIFPTMKDLDPSLPAYAAYTGEHWRVAAGYPAATVFAISDAVQLVCAMIATVSLITLIAIARVRLSRPAMIIRLGSFVLGMVALAYQLFFVAPPMTRYLAGFRVAAQAGENDAAEKYRAAFDALHPVASSTLTAIAGCLFITLVTGAWTAATHLAFQTGHTPTDRVTGTNGSRSSPVIETPLLARTPRR